ncbi:MAG: response regulator transcription factor [Deltaproteobacteria bacterium]|nr:response regulator transcription factor [Deltaproteobacteria bacterium]
MTGGERILIIDDDEKLCRLVREYLGAMGYEVESAHTGSKGLKKALKRDYHAVILDVMLPEMDGFELLKQLRAESLVPVLMLTSRGDETDRIVGLEMGADDYLPKTFSTRELLARLRSVIRRSQMTPAGPTKTERGLCFGSLRLNEDAHEAFLDDNRLDLTPIEYQLLQCLAKAKGRALSREQLLDVVADRNFDVYDRSIDMHISSLRGKLGDDPKNPRFIRTVRSVGYLFMPSLNETRP